MWHVEGGPLPCKDRGIFSEGHTILLKGVLPPLWDPASPLAMLQLPTGMPSAHLASEGHCTAAGPQPLSRAPAPQPCRLDPLHTPQQGVCLLPPQVLSETPSLASQSCAGMCWSWAPAGGWDL